MLLPPLGVKIAAAAGAFALSWHVLAPSTSESPLAGNGTGQVRFVKDANTSFDAEDVLANTAWIKRHFYRMTGYSPWFDRNLGWYQRARVYADAYGIYRGSTVASKHPAWIVRDAAGNRLYIPFECAAGSCPLFAADISNGAWRSYYISKVRAAIAKGYSGVFVDDVDMWANTSNGAGQLVAPLDHNTGKPMTDEAWRSYMVRFMEELRAAIPGREITHNSVWYAAGGPAASAQVAQAMRQANWVNIEFGVNDKSLGGGTGGHSLSSLLAYVDAVHALGASIDMSGSGSSPHELEYTLGGYFLVNNGSDLVTGGNSQTVTHFWRGWSVSLGEAQGPRARSPEGLFERRFTGGLVYLNEPGASTKTIKLPAPMRNVAGQTVSSVSLPAASAAVLRY
jgi:Hypothetical glycosyl hydrolase family 15